MLVLVLNDYDFICNKRKVYVAYQRKRANVACESCSNNMNLNRCLLYGVSNAILSHYIMLFDIFSPIILHQEDYGAKVIPG